LSDFVLLNEISHHLEVIIHLLAAACMELVTCQLTFNNSTLIERKKYLLFNFKTADAKASEDSWDCLVDLFLIESTVTSTRTLVSLRCSMIASCIISLTWPSDNPKFLKSLSDSPSSPSSSSDKLNNENWLTLSLFLRPFDSAWETQTQSPPPDEFLEWSLVG